ncbi:protein toll-like isoform X2 [Anopheles aquasalis]|uniref:protein toll-like isoform X2 n=1 Tax=Anopheles aquasalis TaxID=42839 RepID=UPI00215AB354|nr:protein toll-like isoform X2 [Anopheles aquasalis]
MQTTSSTLYLVVMVCFHLQLPCSGAILTGGCPPKCICPLSSAAGKQEFNCEPYGIHLDILTTHNHLLVHCTAIDHANTFGDIDWKLEAFIASDIVFKQLTLQRCAIPANRSLAELLSPFVAPHKAAMLETVFFVGNHQNGYSAALSPKLFEGLAALKTLSLKNATGVPIVANDLLAHVPGLRWLDVREYSHAFPLELLKYVPNLTTLELGQDPLLSQAVAAGFLNHLDSLEMLMIRISSLEQLPSLSHFQRLKVIDIVANHGLQLTSGDTFANLTQLINVSLKNNHLPELPHDLLHTNTAIKFIDLSLNHLTELSPDFFKAQTSLEGLSLKGNRLQGALPGKLFSSTNKLRHLDLSDNALESINSELFGNLGKLKTLVLSNNRIRVIEPNAFKINPQTAPLIAELYLAHNHLNLNASLQGLFYGLDKLKILDLSYNAITNANHVQYGSTMRGLQYLNLSHNRIANISYSELLFVSKEMKKFSLSANAIDTIDFNDQTESGSLPEKVMLDGNSLRCDCRLHQFVRYLKTKSNQKPTLHVDSLTCGKSNNELSNSTVQGLELKQLLCAVTGEMCPSKCTCTTRPEDRCVIIDCARRGITRVPAIPPPEAFPPYYTATHIELHLEHNRLETLRAPANSSGWHSVGRLIASNNRLQLLDADELPNNLSLLDISNNTLGQLDSSASAVLGTIKDLQLAGNVWYCSCQAQEFVEFAHANRDRITDFSALKCHDGSRLETTTVNTICKRQTVLTIVVSIVFALIGLLCGLATWFYYKYKIEIKVWLFKHNLCQWLTDEDDDDERDAGKRYDAFVSYSHQEESFVAKVLIPGLEKERNFKLCWHQRDFIPGALISTQITKAIEESRRTIVVLSRGYLSSVWGQQEFRTAFQQSVSEKRNRVVAIIYEDIGNVDNLDADLRAYLRSTTYLQWGDTWFWDKLAYAMPHRRKAQTEQSGHRLAQNLQQATVGYSPAAERLDTSLSMP